MKKLENHGLSVSENCILVDYLTVTFHDYSVDQIKVLLGMSASDIDWDDRQVNQDGYPRCCSFNNISIRYGADDASNWTDTEKSSALDKVRYDMGISLNMSGTGCRAFETYGHGDWLQLFTSICNLDSRINFTRLDLAFDDHTGILDIGRIRQDVEDRYYTGSPKTASFVWKDDQMHDLQGLTIYVGSKKSPVFFRIYDKAAERGFKDSHWIRVELCLRSKRALSAVAEILKYQDVGIVFSGVLRNYCCFRHPSGNDSNKSRWPIADYWETLIGDAARIRLWISPGEPYNFYKSEESLIHQYGQVLITIKEIHGSISELIRRAEQAHPVLKKKYLSAIEQYRLDVRLRRDELRRLRDQLMIDRAEAELDAYYQQLDFAELIYFDPNNPWS